METHGTLEERKALQRSSSVKILIALVLMIVAAALTRSVGPELAIVLLIVRIAALVPWFWGLADYARSKGYAAAWAALGILSCIGLLILVLLPNRWIETPPGTGSVYPR